MKKTIEVFVSPHGDIRIDALGFQGADCAQATRFLEEVLGAIVQQEKKPEFYQRTRVAHQQRIGK